MTSNTIHYIILYYIIVVMKLKTTKKSRKNLRSNKTKAQLKRKRATIRGGNTDACKGPSK